MAAKTSQDTKIHTGVNFFRAEIADYFGHRTSNNVHLMPQPVTNSVVAILRGISSPKLPSQNQSPEKSSREEVDETTLSVSLFRLLNVLATDRRHVV